MLARFSHIAGQSLHSQTVASSKSIGCIIGCYCLDSHLPFKCPVMEISDDVEVLEDEFPHSL